MEKKLKAATLCVRGGWKPKNGEPVQPPIVQSTTFKYDDSDEMGMLFDLKKEGYFYTRLQNPTNDAVAAKIAALEGGVGAMLTSSGQAANFYAMFNICEAGDHFVTSNEIYGGTYNLFGVTMKKFWHRLHLCKPWKRARRRYKRLSALIRKRFSARPSQTPVARCLTLRSSPASPIRTVCRSSWTTRLQPR